MTPGKMTDEKANTAPEGERFIYVMPEETIRGVSEGEMSLSDIWTALWRGKLILVMTTTTFAVLSIVYSLMATEWYRAEVLMSPASQRSTQVLPGTLSGLASLAGVGIGNDSSDEAIAVLRSREFTSEFIHDWNLMPVFFSDQWDHESGEWIRNEAEESPDIRDGIKYFSENVRSVAVDNETGLVTLAIEWKDATVAANWANALVDRLNARMRQRALIEAERNLSYLQGELSKTSVVTLQQSIARLMENELQKLMLARGNDEFSFKVIDPAQPPKFRSRPRRTLIVVVSTFIGGALGALWILLVQGIDGKRMRDE